MIGCFLLKWYLFLKYLSKINSIPKSIYDITLVKFQLVNAFFALINLSTPAHEQYRNAIHQTRIANHKSNSEREVSFFRERRGSGFSPNPLLGV